ncbi:hypothetical protein [Intestinibacter sp.]|uniref:hypothetical protein n=1 Tax=Intestinibacter sp. TaxID=1965304 RepID=UPI002A7510BE|nr:hypothetical protein [Intestinibacter sp.]
MVQVAPASEEYSKVNALPFKKANLFALCSLERAIPIGLTVPACALPPHDNASSFIDVASMS